MSIENQIAVNADEPEQSIASELLDSLIKDGYVYIDGYVFDAVMITDTLEAELLKELSVQLLFGNVMDIRKIYIDAIQSLME